LGAEKGSLGKTPKVFKKEGPPKLIKGAPANRAGIFKVGKRRGPLVGGQPGKFRKGGGPPLEGPFGIWGKKFSPVFKRGPGALL